MVELFQKLYRYTLYRREEQDHLNFELVMRGAKNAAKTNRKVREALKRFKWWKKGYEERLRKRQRRRDRKSK